jgi:hypothetical protein
MAQEFWRLARREQGAYPQRSVTSEQRRQPPKEPARMLKLFFHDALGSGRLQMSDNKWQSTGSIAWGHGL